LKKLKPDWYLEETGKLMPNATVMIIHPDIRAKKEEIAEFVQEGLSKEEIYQCCEDYEAITSVDNWQA
jgi:hypothetical protein